MKKGVRHFCAARSSPLAQKSQTLILASKSPRRKKLLKPIWPSFRIIPSRVREPAPGKTQAAAYARKLALAKALQVARSCPNTLVLGADTVVVLRNKILGKPKTGNQAFRMLKALQGTTHRVITAIALVDTQTRRALVKHETSRVTMRKLTEREIRRYAHKHTDKAGAYAVQDKRDPVVTKIVGSYTNVVGLPVKLVRQMLATASC